MLQSNIGVKVEDFEQIFRTIAIRSVQEFSSVKKKWNEAATKTLARQFFTFYQEPVRTYHGVGHPYLMFNSTFDLEKKFKVISKRLVDLTALYWMIMGHDIVIKFGQAPGWNEAESARLTGEIMRRLGYPEQFVAFVERGINATAKHTLVGILEDEQPTVAFLLDLDLMGLGQPFPDFTADTESIWLEYQPHITRGAYDAGRKEWAAQFLERPRIYHTVYFADKEAQAIANLRALADS